MLIEPLCKTYFKVLAQNPSFVKRIFIKLLLKIYQYDIKLLYRIL